MTSGKIALIHDYLNQRGGAERVFAHIARAYPDAPIYTSMLNPVAIGDLIDVKRVRTSFLQHFPMRTEGFRFLAPLYPLAFERFDLSEFDVVISSTTAWAKGVITRPDAIHVSYMNTVSRFAFDYNAYVGGLLGGGTRFQKMAASLVRPLLEPLLEWDRRAAQRPTICVANSQNVAKRIKAYYHRDARVLPCPVDVDSFYIGSGKGGYALVVSRLLPYKRVDIAIDACAQAGMPLIIIGTGPAEAALRDCARGTNTIFLGSVDDAERAQYMAEAHVILLPGEEDFGLVPIEAAAAGRPTIAYGAGGALETMITGETGLFFSELCSDSLAQVLHRFDATDFDPQRLRAHAENFAPARFSAQLRAIVDEACKGRTVETTHDRTQVEIS
jgi:glycosyltransferase involved in cell wall biosynthesis